MKKFTTDSIIIITGFFIIHTYVYAHLLSFLDLSKQWYFYPLALGLATIFPITTLLIKKAHTPIRRLFYVGSATWLGAMFILCIALIAFDAFAWFGVAIPVLGLFIVYGCLLLYALINGQVVRTKSICVPLKNLKKPLTIVHLSDLHLGAVWTEKYLAHIIKKTNALRADFIVITGDIFDGSSPMSPAMIQPLNDADAPVFVVTGNHDFIESPTKVYDVFKSTKAVVLRNEMKVCCGVQIVGLDYSHKKGNIKRMLAAVKIDKKKPSILLYHTPSSIEHIQEAGINLQLSGHTHNGQVFPLNFLVRLAYKHISGLYVDGDSYIYVSQGTAYWGPPLRLGSRNEITHIRLVPK